jgi:cytidylate kinase
MIIAIDGPAASGKSTIAREVAKKLNYRFVSTGAMYRAITYRVLKEKLDVYDEKAPARIAQKYNVSFSKVKDHPQERVFIDSEDVTDFLFTPKVDSTVSFVARNPGVREQLVNQQRELSKPGDVVMEGRDIGTVVLPQADVKIFLTASTGERARRRKIELEKKGYTYDEQRLKRELVYRDKIDTSRKVSPLAKASGAYLLDTTDKTIEEVIDLVMEIVKGI